LSGGTEVKAQRKVSPSIRAGVFVFVGLAAVGVALGSQSPRAVQKQQLVFRDAAAQAKEFIGYYHSIPLSPQQQKVKEDALGAIKAPCCKDYPVLTCCCPCNMAKTVWGLSQYLIARKGYEAAEVRDAVTRWLEFINPGGYTGNACYTGGCSRPFAENGCGGMDESKLVAARRGGR
jgi:hypothetical protein